MGRIIPPLGHFEQIVLLAVLRLGDSAYGVSIRREIGLCTRRKPSPGALYTTLDRLEAKGLLKSSFGSPTAERGGRAKRFFKATRRGSEAIAQAQRSFRRLLRGLPLLGGSHA